MSRPKQTRFDNDDLDLEDALYPTPERPEQDKAVRAALPVGTDTQGVMLDPIYLEIAKRVRVATVNEIKKRLADQVESFDLDTLDVDDTFAVLDEVSALATPPSAAPPALDALAPIRGLRITAGQIEDALNTLGPSGNRAEAYVKAAAQAAADSLHALSPDQEEATE